MEYRPVFITGDVTRAGEQPFRPRMTVRQALGVSRWIFCTGPGQRDVVRCGQSP